LLAAGQRKIHGRRMSSGGRETVSRDAWRDTVGS